MMKYLKNFSLLFLIFIISKTFSTNANNIYFINSTANNLTEIDQYSLKNFLLALFHIASKPDNV